jgi:hypothetical protein
MMEKPILEAPVHTSSWPEVYYNWIVIQTMELD